MSEQTKNVFASFVNRSHWDPFSDVVTASRELDRSSVAMRQEIDRFWGWSGQEMERFRGWSGFDKSMPIFSRFRKNGK